MELAFICIIIAFAFFAQSLMGFGGGLICIPLLSLLMPVQDAVTMVILYQFSMGLLIFKTRAETGWPHIRAMIPATIIGVLIGVVSLKYLHGDYVRIALVSYIALHMIRTHTPVDPLGKFIKWGGAHLAGFMGGTMNAMIGGGGPAFILYLKDKSDSAREFRANITAMLFISNIPRVITSYSIGMFKPDVMILGLMAYPGFLIAMYLGQKLHDKIPQKIFFRVVEAILVVTAISLTLKVIWD